jgi:hypothetical protein
MNEDIKLLNEIEHAINDNILTNKIYQAIIDQINTIDNKIVCIDGTKYKIPHDKEIKRAALNIVLVLKKGRLCYRIDLGRELNNIIISVLNSLTDQLTSIAIIPKEPLIFLSYNGFLVSMVFQKEKDLHMAFGKVLEYEYIQKNNVTNIKKSYSITYEADNGNDTITLYSYNVPINKYTKEISDKISEKVKLYTMILRPYGYTVTSKILLY